MNPSLAAQTLCVSVGGAIDFCGMSYHYQFQDSKATTIKHTDLVLDLINRRNPFSKETRLPVILEYFPNRPVNMKLLYCIIFDLKKACFLQNGKLI